MLRLSTLHRMQRWRTSFTMTRSRLWALVTDGLPAVGAEEGTLKVSPADLIILKMHIINMSENISVKTSAARNWKCTTLLVSSFQLFFICTSLGLPGCFLTCICVPQVSSCWIKPRASGWSTAPLSSPPSRGKASTRTPAVASPTDRTSSASRTHSNASRPSVRERGRKAVLTPCGGSKWMMV